MSAARSIGAALVLLTAMVATAGAQESKPSKPAPAAPAAPAPPAAAPAVPAAPAPAPAAAENRVITTEPVHAIVLPMKGAYAQHQAAFEKLGGFLGSKGVTPAGAPFARYLNDPTTPEADLSWEVGFPVAAGVTAEAPFEVRDIPATLTAVHVHRGSFDELGSAWPAFIQWVMSNGYQVSGPATQVFKDFMAPEVELRLPVQK